MVAWQVAELALVQSWSCPDFTTGVGPMAGRLSQVTCMSMETSAAPVEKFAVILTFPYAERVVNNVLVLPSIWRGMADTPLCGQRFLEHRKGRFCLI